MAIALNHYFTLVDKSFPQKKDLLKQGFKVTGPKSHKGQGTSAEFIFFPENYFEYIWIDDLEVSRNNFLKLYRRSQEGACKYGLCFAGELPKKHLSDFVMYEPPYSRNNKLLFCKESMDDLSMPLIFMLTNSKDPKDSEPQNNKNIPKDVLNPQENFFIPDEIKSLKIPDYLKGLI